MSTAFKQESEILAGLAADGSIAIVGGVYNVATGEVDFTVGVGKSRIQLKPRGSSRLLFSEEQPDGDPRKVPLRANVVFQKPLVRVLDVLRQVAVEGECRRL